MFYEKYLFLICILLIGFLLGFLIQGLRFSRKLKQERKDAIKRSRSVLGGQFYEQISPLLPNFPCNPGDCHFLGKPIDFVAFKGSAKGEEIQEILFIEVKTGSSQLSTREKSIKELIQQGKIRYIEYRIPSLEE